MYLHSFYVPENDKGHKNRLAYNPICFLTPNEQQNYLHVLWIGSGRYWCVLDDFELSFFMSQNVSRYIFVYQIYGIWYAFYFLGTTWYTIYFILFSEEGKERVYFNSGFLTCPMTTLSQKLKTTKKIKTCLK